MNFLFLLEHFPCTSETFVLNQITALKDMGHQVYIYPTGRKDPDTVVHEDYISYDLDKQVYRSPKNLCQNKIIRFFQIISFLYLLFKKVRWNAFRLLNTKRYGKIAMNGLLLHHAAFFPADLDVDAVIVHFADMGLYASAMQKAGIIKNTVFVFVHAHEIAALSSERIAQRFGDMFANKNLYLFPISKFWQNKLKQSGAAEPRNTVIHMGIDLKRFTCNCQIKAHEELTILSVGRLVGQKGYKYSIPAVAKFVELGGHCLYKIIGSGYEEDELRSLIKEHNAENYISLEGAKSQQEVFKALEECDIFLLPSVTDNMGLMEGIPVALMEAMAMKKAVISTFHSGIPELVDHMKSGFLCKEKDVDNIVKGLEFFSEKDSRERFGIEARKKIEQEYDLNKIIHLLIEQVGSCIK